jgi:hypothetical protein
MIFKNVQKLVNYAIAYQIFLYSIVVNIMLTFI